jgi:S-adenosylmethionine hydrolase
MVGGAERVIVLDDTSRHLEGASRTFAARDVYAPVAAHLCSGVPFAELGSPTDATSLRPGLLPVARHEDDGLVAEVLWVDRFGNAQLNLDADDVAPFGERVRLEVSGRTRVVHRVAAFADLGVGELGLLVDSFGLMLIAADRSSVAEELELAVGDAVTLASADPALDGVTTPVQLGRRPEEAT